jgi:release factor glutamine methyltransferase
VSFSVAQLLSRGGRDAEDRRDAEVLLCHSLGRPRSYLYAWPEAEVPAAVAEVFLALLQRRQAGEPVAYLLGEREFWSLPLRVTADTLIPRPETETLVARALALALPAAARVLDLGTGCGAIALALACERPRWSVTGCDISAAALAVARGNGARLGLERVQWLQGDWLSPVAGARFDLVVANPPYLAADDPHLGQGDLRFEPRSALVADGGAFADYERIIAAAPAHLNENAWLLFEHGMEQGAGLRERLAGAGFASIDTWQDDGGRDRVSGGQWMGAQGQGGSC